MKSVDFMLNQVPLLMKSLPVTLEILVLSVIIALILGILLTYAKIGSNKWLSSLASLYISFMRGTPMLVQLLLVFVGLPLLLGSMGLSTDSWNTIIYAIIAFSLNEAAFFSEIFRAAFRAIDKGQIEAGESIGLTSWQIFWIVILPQTAARALPNTTNMIIELLKNTSLGLAIGVTDILAQAKQLSSLNYGVGQSEIFIVAALMYWMLSVILTTISHHIYIRLNRFNSHYQFSK
ncbi:MAG: amino acid ABC transporter permease [Sporolactobacillus sp.]